MYLLIAHDCCDMHAFCNALFCMFCCLGIPVHSAIPDFLHAFVVFTALVLRSTLYCAIISDTRVSLVQMCNHVILVAHSTMNHLAYDFASAQLFPFSFKMVCNEKNARLLFRKVVVWSSIEVLLRWLTNIVSNY